MRKILLVTHGSFAEGIVSSLTVIVGNDCGVSRICVMEEDTPETIDGKINAFIEGCDETDIKLIVTDIPGGSTTTNAIRHMNSEKNIYLIAGLNLGLLLELALSQDENIEDHIRDVIENSKATIMFINDMIPKS